MPPKKARARTLKTSGLVKSKKVKITKTSKSIHITYSDPRHVLPHLMGLVSEFTDKHFATDVPTDEDVLGTDAAKEIVSGCANSDCWICTLGDLKLDSTLFQGCVYAGVQGKGYTIARDKIPASQDTQLYAVVIAIQGAKHQ